MIQRVMSPEDQGPVKIDAKDLKILAILADNGRIPASELAKKVLLSRDAVAYRLKKLQDAGVLLSVVPIIDLELLGFSTFRVFMLLDEKARSKHESFLSALKKHPNTRSVMSYTDTWDVEWTVVASSLKSFDKILTEMLTSFPDAVLEKEQLAVVKRYLSNQVPASYQESSGVKREPHRESPIHGSTIVDEKDMGLLKALCKDSRQSSYEIGKSVGMSPDAVMYRLKKIQEGGLIKKFSPLLNLSRLGFSWYTYAITFRVFDANEEKRLIEFVRTHPHILSAAKTFGAWDVVLSIVTASPKEYHETVKAIKNQFSQVIFNYQTWLAHEELFFTPMPAVVADVVLKKD